MKSLAEQPPRVRVLLAILQTGGVVLMLGAILFGSAGTFDWPRAWMLLVVFAVCGLITAITLNLKIPGLMDERRKKHENVKRWDRILVRAFTAMYFPMFILCGLTVRLDWAEMPMAMSVIGLLLIPMFYGLITWAPLVNNHLEYHVRIQTDRDHTVCDRGPYRAIRHPAYAGLVLFFLGVPVSLGSWWGLLPGLVAVCVIAVRTVLEERTLRAELPGYEDYMRRVRYRWIPGVW